MLVAGNQHAQAVVRVMAVDEDGQVHFTVLPGSLEKNRHLIGRALAQILAADQPEYPLMAARYRQKHSLERTHCLCRSA